MSPYSIPVAGWALFLVLSPVYLFRSGLPQISDYLFAVVVVLMLLARQLRVPPLAAGSMRALWAFTAYVLLVNVLWVVLTGLVAMAQIPAFYLYNALAVAVTFALYGRGGTAFLRVTLYAVAATIFLMLLAAPLRLNIAAGRQTLFFNNPNQLGYFALLSACIFAIGSRQVHVTRLLQVLMYLGCLFLIVVSLSKAAILGMVLLVVALTVRRPLVVGTAAVVLWGISPAMENTRIMRNLEIRVGRIGQDADDDWAHRGYDRIANHPEHLFLGAGEGATERWDSEASGELHSSWGTLLFCYGIVGTLLFALFLRRTLQGAGIEQLMILAPVFLYGFTHQGLRTTHLWILFAFTACVVMDQRAAAARGRGPEPAVRTPPPHALLPGGRAAHAG